MGSSTPFSLFAAALCVLCLAGCGPGLGDGVWRTVFFDAFNVADGPLDLGSTYTFAGTSVSVVSARVHMLAGGTGAALYYNPRITSTRQRVSFKGRMIETGQPFALAVMGADSKIIGPTQAYVCGFFGTFLVLRKSANGDTASLVPDASSSHVWGVGEEFVVTLEKAGGTLRCSSTGPVQKELTATDDDYDSGFAGIFTDDFGAAPEVHVDDFKIER